MDGVTVMAGGGAFDTGKVNLQAGKKIGDLDIALTFDYLTTTGENLRIDQDSMGNSGDTRDSVDAYALVDLPLIAKDFYENLEVRGIVKNIFDKVYEDPAPASVPGDFPREGISFLFDVMVKF